MQIANSDKPVAFYSLDVIISVGYRVNSIRATAFRQWATSILKQYMIKGYAVNQNAVSEQKYEDLKRALGLFLDTEDRWYHTSVVLSIDFEKGEFTTQNSIYRFEFIDV